jgi:hypothetical protein
MEVERYEIEIGKIVVVTSRVKQPPEEGSTVNEWDNI